MSEVKSSFSIGLASSYDSGYVPYADSHEREPPIKRRLVIFLWSGLKPVSANLDQPIPRARYSATLDPPDLGS